MEEIKNLFIKHFGFLPDVISTTEHAYISPPSRIISSLTKLSKLLDSKVLRIIITDRYSIHPENCVEQICIPHILNKKVFNFNNINLQEEFIKKIEEDNKKIEDILQETSIFSLEEKNNYIRLINLYKKTLKNIDDFGSVNIYNNIIRMYTDDFQLDTLGKWLRNTKSFGIDSKKVRKFLKEAFDILYEKDPVNIDLFGKYLETKKRLKKEKADNTVELINWEEYLKGMGDISGFYSVPFEIILYVYSYCGGSHFGNDYGIVSDINKIRNNDKLLQITEHNRDYDFIMEENGVQFQKVSMIKENWNLSHKMYKTVNTLSELYILLGRDNLKNNLKK